MRTKNKMKDSDVECEEWWEVAKENFAKELENNLTQHGADEKNLRYKLEIYQRNFPKFVYGNPTSTEISGRDEEIETRPNEISQGEEVQTGEPHEFKGGGQEGKELQTIQEQKHMEVIPTIEVKQSKM
jgi:hypothetical protein